MILYIHFQNESRWFYFGRAYYSTWKICQLYGTVSDNKSPANARFVYFKQTWTAIPLFFNKIFRHKHTASPFSVSHVWKSFTCWKIANYRRRNCYPFFTYGIRETASSSTTAPLKWLMFRIIYWVRIPRKDARCQSRLRYHPLVVIGCHWSTVDVRLLLPAFLI